MNIVNKNDMVKFIQSNQYDLRISKNARWIDQKCTPDIWCFIADCIIQHNVQQEFTKNDLWHSQYAQTYIPHVFNKPHLNLTQLSNEYDKFFAQPLEMLTAAKILRREKRKSNFYSILNMNLLTYIARKELYALEFICEYCNKVIDDSGLRNHFDSFFLKQTQDSYNDLKETYVNFIIIW